MRSKVPAALIVVGLVVLVASASAFAMGPAKAVVAKVSFPFVVGDRTMQAGTYRVSQPAGLGMLKIEAVGGKENVPVQVITRISQVGNSAQGGRTALVFDVVGDQHYLSEVWIPGQDGFLVRGTTEEHKHAAAEGTGQGN